MGDSENEEPSAPKKAKTFSCKEFRAAIKGSEALKSLKKFVSAAKTSEDVVYDYLEGGGSVLEILSLIDSTASGDLTTALPVFEAIHLILLRFQSPDSEYHQICVEGAKLILNSHIVTVKAMLSMNITKQKKVALKLLTAIVTMQSTFASEVLNLIQLSPTMMSDFIIPSPEKESLRKCFILFTLSFLIEGNSVVLKNFLDNKGFLSSIIPGLKFDDSNTVNLVLSLFEDKILKNTKINKTLKLKIFNTQIIKAFFDLYDWKGPQSAKELHTLKKSKVKQVEVNQKEKEVVVESVHSFLLLLCCSKKFGIAFVDKSIGTSDQLSNQLLLTVFESLPDPLRNQKIAEVMLKTMASCPDIIKPVLLKLEPSFQPRNSKLWFDAMDFAENLIKEVNVCKLLKTESEVPSPGQVIKVAKALCSPIVLLRVAKSGAQKSQPMLIRLCSLKLLTTMWNEVQNLSTTFPKYVKDLKKASQQVIFKYFPEISELVELWNHLCDAEYLRKASVPLLKRYQYLTVVLTSIQIAVECQKESIASPHTLISGLLKSSEQIKTIKGNEFQEIQVKIAQLVEVDLDSLTPDTELFEKSLLILLQSTLNLSNASKILTKIQSFKEHEEEVDVWLLCFSLLPEEHCSVVAGFLVKAFRELHKTLLYSQSSEGLNDNMEIDSDPSKTLSPLIFKCFELLKDVSSSSPPKNEIQSFQQYLNNVIIHIQHFYTNDIFVYDHIKSEKKLFSKSVMNYLKSWKNNSVQSEHLDVFSPSDQDLVNWLLNENDERNFKDVVNIQKSGILDLYKIFNIIVAYLTNKVGNECLNTVDTKKYTQALKIFTKFQDLPTDIENFNVVSQNLKNESIFYGYCISSLFKNNFLLNSFNVFEKKNESCSCCTDMIVKVLMESSGIKNFAASKNLVGNWKQKFLKQIKSKLKKNKSIDDVVYVETVLNFFEYDDEEIETFLQLLISTTDLELFINEEQLSMWTTVLVKFIKLYCAKEPLKSHGVKSICNIFEYISQKNCSNMEVLDECFVHLLREHPVHVLDVGNEFVNVILNRTHINPSAITIGKLLLNDPPKVGYFLDTISKNLDLLENPELIFPLLEVLIIKRDDFLEAVKSKDTCVLWRMSDIKDSKASKLHKVLSFVYKKFEKQIFRTSRDGGMFLWKNLEFIRELIKLFLDEKETKLIKKSVSKGTYDPEVVFEAIKKISKKEISEVFFQNLLAVFCKTIKNYKEYDEEILWPKYGSIISNLITLHNDISWKNLIESSNWKEFVKLSIGHCFSTSKHSELLKILRLVISSLPQEEKLFSLIFQMVISHSQFLNIILSKSPLKSELVELFYCLVMKTPSEMSQKHIPILLASYNASLSFSDQTLLKILRLYESSGINVNEYEPFVWAETAVSHYSVGSNAGLSLWQRFNMANILDLLDSNRIEYSLINFPIHRTLEPKENSNFDDGTTYDPAFLLPLFANLLSPGAVVFCLSFIYKGALGYTIRALSSECNDVRVVASVVLSRFYNHLEIAQNLKQKLVWMHFINCFRFGIKDLTKLCLPNITTLFFARMTLELSKPPAEMHAPLQNFLLAKSYFVFYSVPEFLPLFHSSEVAHWKHREWLLKVLKDGTKTTLDLNIIFYSMAPKVVFCYFHSPLCDNDTRKLILQVIESIIKVEKSILLISEYSLLNWIQTTDTNCLSIILPDLVKLLSVTVSVIIKDITSNKSKHTNSSHLVQSLNLLIKLLPHVKSSKSMETFETYIKIILNIFVLFFKEKKADWFEMNKEVLDDIVELGVAVLGENYNCGKFRKVPFYVRDCDDIFGKGVGQDLKRIVYLFCKLAHSQNT